MGKGHWIVHLSWVIVILILSLCAVIVASPNGEIIRDYVSFAGAVSSIILALIAIIYAFISNQSISNATATLTHSVASAERSSERVKVGAEAIEGAVQSLKEEFSGIGPAVEGINQRLEEVNSPFSNDSSQEDRTISKDNSAPLGYSPGLDATLYSLALSSRNGDKPVVYVDIFGESDTTFSWVDYCIAAATTLSAISPCGLRIKRRLPSDGRRSEYTISSWGELSPDEIIRAVEERSSIPQWALEAMREYFAVEDY